jgi:hypothetical protein
MTYNIYVWDKMPPKQRSIIPSEFIIPTGSFEIPHGLTLNGAEKMVESRNTIEVDSDFYFPPFDTWLLEYDHDDIHKSINMRNAINMPDALDKTEEFVPYLTNGGIMIKVANEWYLASYPDEREEPVIENTEEQFLTPSGAVISKEDYSIIKKAPDWEQLDPRHNKNYKLEDFKIIEGEDEFDYDVYAYDELLWGGIFLSFPGINITPPYNMSYGHNVINNLAPTIAVAKEIGRNTPAFLSLVNGNVNQRYYDPVYPKNTNKPELIMSSNDIGRWLSQLDGSRTGPGWYKLNNKKLLTVIKTLTTMIRRMIVPTEDELEDQEFKKREERETFGSNEIAVMITEGRMKPLLTQSQKQELLNRWKIEKSYFLSLSESQELIDKHLERKKKLRSSLIREYDRLTSEGIVRNQVSIREYWLEQIPKSYEEDDFSGDLRQRIELANVVAQESLYPFLLEYSSHMARVGAVIFGESAAFMLNSKVMPPSYLAICYTQSDTDGWYDLFKTFEKDGWKVDKGGWGVEGIYGSGKYTGVVQYVWRMKRKDTKWGIYLHRLTSGTSPFEFVRRFPLTAMKAIWSPASYIDSVSGEKKIYNFDLTPVNVIQDILNMNTEFLEMTHMLTDVSPNDTGNRLRVCLNGETIDMIDGMVNYGFIIRASPQSIFTNADLFRDLRRETIREKEKPDLKHDYEFDDIHFIIDYPDRYKEVIDELKFIYNYGKQIGTPDPGGVYQDFAKSALISMKAKFGIVFEVFNPRSVVDKNRIALGNLPLKSEVSGNPFVMASISDDEDDE